MKVTSKALKNNFKVILARDNSNPLVCLQLYSRIGSAWEEKNEAGYSHLTEHLVFKSTSSFPKNTIMNKITNLGGTLNAYTEFDSTCFYVTLPSKFTEEGVKIISELAMQANFSNADFISEKKVVIEELKQFKNEPEDSFIEDISADYFTKNPYKKPIIGHLASLQNADPDSLRRFYKKYYVPNNCFLVASGDIDGGKLVGIVEKFFGDWKPNVLKVRKRMRNNTPTNYKIKYMKKNISSMLAFVMPDLAETDPDAYSLSLATKAFAIGRNSRLFNRLFTEEKLIDGVRVHSLSGINDGASVIIILPKKKADITKIVSIFLDELNQFYLSGMSDNELADNKKELIYFYRYTFEYIESLASSLGSEEILSGYMKFFEYPEMIRNITHTDLKRVINNYFKKEQLHLYYTGKEQIDEKFIKTKLLKKVSQKDILSEQTYFETQLDSGIKILFKKVTGKPTIGISLSYEVSQLNETKDNLGINYLTSSLMLYGNEKRNYQQFVNYCTSNGINFGVSPQSEATIVSAKCFKEQLPASLELLCDVALKPTFPMEHFKNIKMTTKSNLDRVKDYPQHYSALIFKELIFGKKSNLTSRSGYKSVIQNITLKQIKQWYKKHYHPENMSLAVVGDFNFDDALRLCKTNFIFNKNNFSRSLQKPIINSSKNKYKLTKKGLDQVVINIGGFGCKATEKIKTTAFHVLAQIIGGDSDSILFTELREKHGLAYSVNFSFSSIRSTGFWVASAVVDRSNKDKALKIIQDVLDSIKTNGISQERLQTTKNYIRGQRLMEQESVLNQAQTLSVLESLGLGYSYYLSRDERLEKVNRKILHTLATQYFKTEDQFIHILT